MDGFYSIIHINIATKKKDSQIHEYFYDICKNTLNTSHLGFNVKSKIEHVAFVDVCEFLCKYNMKFSNEAKLYGTKCISVFFFIIIILICTNT